MAILTLVCAYVLGLFAALPDNSAPQVKRALLGINRVGVAIALLLTASLFAGIYAEIQSRQEMHELLDLARSTNELLREGNTAAVEANLKELEHRLVSSSGSSGGSW